MNITLKDTGSTIRIYINSILHLMIDKPNLVNIRSWYISPDKDPDPFFIELTYKTTKVICQYDSREKWLQILKLIDELP